MFQDAGPMVRVVEDWRFVTTEVGMKLFSLASVCPDLAKF